MSKNITLVINRKGEKRSYQPERIILAINKAFKESRTDISQETLNRLLKEVESTITTNPHNSQLDRIPSVHIEYIQDIIEKVLMKNKFYSTAKSFIIYRQKRAEKRLMSSIGQQKKIHKLHVTKRDGRIVPFSLDKILVNLRRVTHNIDTDKVPLDPIILELEKNIYDRISSETIDTALVLSATSFIEQDPRYNIISSRLLRQQLYKEVLGKSVGSEQELEQLARENFSSQIARGIKENIFHKDLANFKLDLLAKALDFKRDDQLGYLGLKTLYDRYLVKQGLQVIETIQAFWMRVCMGLAIREKDKNAKAIEFYSLLSQLYYIPSTPTLFHSGLKHSQLSSCYISTVGDELQNIFKCIGDNAQMAKWSGGIGNDWTSVRATNALIKSTNVDSQGVIPFLKIANDTTLAINRSGKRRGATCAYLEIWHLDIEDFFDLRRNTGDERRRTHDMNTAAWIPDLFMKRVEAEESWTLFSPDEVPDLHESYGSVFEKKYLDYEALARKGELRNHRTIDAVKLWRKLLSRLFETGHPWITFKDPCNVRSPQNHVGIIHNSNLCTEITLNNSKTETAVCNLGSINLARHVTKEGINRELLAKTIQTSMRMLDNVIDINFYPTKEAKDSNFKHRPVGLGIMGLQDALFTLRLPFHSPQTISLMDETMEFISYHTILSSSKLAKERAPYLSYPGSKWDQNLLPIDTLDLLEKERGLKIKVNRNSSLDWTPVREHIKKHGMRNSNTMAIAPTATISNIAGCFPCTEPIYKNLYVKSNMSGEFTITNEYLVNDLKSIGLWSKKILDQIKYLDGNISLIKSIPKNLKELYQETFEIDPNVLIKLAAVRAKWIDQSQSHNVFIKGTSGKKLNDVYMSAWKMGLKTTYYLRTLGATQNEKSTIDSKEYGLTQKRSYQINLTDEVSSPIPNEPEKLKSPIKLPLEVNQKVKLMNHPVSETSFKLPSVATPASQVNRSNCSILDPECDSCQ